jgi:DNA-binding Lrp family transcriptional regulator
MSERQAISTLIEQMLSASNSVTSGQVAKEVGVSRETANVRLREMVASGKLIHEGAGRGGRYRKLATHNWHYSLVGLREDIVWSSEFAELKRRDPIVLDNPNVGKDLQYSFTEMLNNAIDHSKGVNVDVRWFVTDKMIAYEIEDDGIGVFRNVREERNLESDVDSIGEIAKGKQTTAPTAHSGLGIYFSSRMVSRYILSSGMFVWTVDSRRDDQAIGSLSTERIGTFVRCEVDADIKTVPSDVFRKFAPLETGFNRSTLRVSLFEKGDFVSRSEAKRMGAQLEMFDEVEIDFANVEQVGQGFIDELFRVWQNAHSDTRLVPINTNPAIDALFRLSGLGIGTT